MNMFAKLVRRIADLEAIVNRLDIFTANLIREGMVKKVDPSKGVVEIDAEGIVTKEITQSERAGAISEWNPFTVGERVLVLNPSGEPGRGIAIPGGYTDSNPAPDNEGAAKVTKIGDATIKHTSAGIVFTVGGTSFSFTAAGFVQTGGKQEHDGKNVGSDHLHTEVTPGPALTGPPQ